MGNLLSFITFNKIVERSHCLALFFNIMFVVLPVIVCLINSVLADLNFRIVGGFVAHQTEFPYVVSLQIDGMHLCAGTILNNNTVLTSAHCLKDNLTVFAGNHDLTDEGFRFEVAEMIPHPRYYSFYYDIALLKIDGFFTFGRNVRAVELDSQRIVANVPCIACGWGRENITSQASHLLNYVDLETVSSQICHVMYKLIEIDIGIQHICTISKFGKGVCLGDSGGPLLSVDNKQIGIVSFVRPCGIGFPDGFSRISHFLPWINEHMQLEHHLA